MIHSKVMIIYLLTAILVIAMPVFQPKFSFDFIVDWWESMTVTLKVDPYIYEYTHVLCFILQYPIVKAGTEPNQSAI